MNPEMEKRLSFCPRLPTLSGVALRILEMGRNPEVELDDLTGLLLNDPALAAKILRVASSPLYGRRRKAQNLRQAIAILGLSSTVTLTLSFSLAACLRDVGEQSIDLDHFWRRALLSGLASRLLGEELGMRSLEELFLAGLLQDIGMLALQAALPERYASVVDGAADHETMVAREGERIGTDHSEAGAWLMRAWGLPEYLSLATLASHEPGPGCVPADLASFIGCVTVSGRVADIYLAPEMENATAMAVKAADAYLGMDRQTLSKILARMAESLPGVEALFEVSILSARQAMGVTDQARELLIVRNLQLVQLATEAKVKGEEFQRISHRLREIARRDPLTGVFNRLHFDEALEKAFAQASEQGWPLSMCYLDLDHFKAINDRYGHQAGDAALVAVAHDLQGRLRQCDLLARYGGEEFVLLLPGTGLASARKVIERLRLTIEALGHRLESGEALHMTFSAGVAAHMDGERCMEKPADLVRAADRALYLAKRQGRNCVESAD